MQLLQHFHELSLHPANANELKALILELAVRGKLTSHWRLKNTDVESTESLLRKIETKKQRLLADKIFRGKYDTDYFEPLIFKPTIPQTWQYVTVGKICELLTGATPSRAKSEYFGGDIRWMVSGDIHKEYIYDCENRITQAGLNSSNCKILPVNSILIALNGQGKTRATVALLKTEAACNQSLVAMKPYLDDEWLSEYIYLSLKGKYYQIREITGQKQRRGLNMTLVSQLPIPLPPLEEQKAIVKVVEQLFAEVDQFEQLTEERIQLKEQFATSALRDLTTNNTVKEWELLQPHFHTFFNEEPNIKKLREAILQLAVQGKLTAHWRSIHSPFEGGQGDAKDHDALLLLESIKQEKAQLIKEGKIRKEKPLPEITEDEIPYELPEGWVWCRFQEVFDIRDGTHDSPKYINSKDSYPLITSKDFKNGEIDFSNSKRISKEDYIKIIQRSGVEKDDVLFSMIGGNIGNQVVVGLFTDFAIKNVALFKYYNKDLSVPNFLKIFSIHIAYDLQSKAIGGAQPFISLTNLRNILLPFPPLKEQKAIVETVNHLMALCDELEQQVKLSKEQVEDWMKGSLREVLGGNN